MYAHRLEKTQTVQGFWSPQSVHLANICKIVNYRDSVYPSRKTDLSIVYKYYIFAMFPSWSTYWVAALTSKTANIYSKKIGDSVCQQCSSVSSPKVRRRSQCYQYWSCVVRVPSLNKHHVHFAEPCMVKAKNKNNNNFIPSYPIGPSNLQYEQRSNHSQTSSLSRLE